MGKVTRNLRRSVEQRLQFIEFRFFWRGMVRRKDLMSQFGISTPQASADLAEYRRRAQNNSRYDSSLKAYVPTQEFKPQIFDPSAGDYFMRLRLVADGIKGESNTWLDRLPPFITAPTIRRHVSSLNLRKVLNAIKNSRAIQIQYHSVNNPGPTCRWITPHALGFDGFRWHIRAWCHQRRDFRDFVFSRMAKVTKDQPGNINPKEDLEWIKEITLRIGPNPRLTPRARKIISVDYGMKKGELKLKTRASLSWYVERYLGLDLEQYGVPPERQQIVLLNRNEINKVRNKLKERVRYKSSVSGVPYSPTL